jgi:hypothetical protein
MSQTLIAKVITKDKGCDTRLRYGGMRWRGRQVQGYNSRCWLGVCKRGMDCRGSEVALWNSKSSKGVCVCVCVGETRVR